MNDKMMAAQLRRLRRSQRGEGFAAPRERTVIDKGQCWICGKWRTGTTLPTGNFACSTCLNRPSDTDGATAC